MIQTTQGTSIKVTDTNTGSTIDLTDIIASVAPQLKAPAILDLIRNTSVNPADSMTAQAVYFGSTYADKTDLKKGSTFNDPRSATAGEVEAEVVRHEAESGFAKKQMLGWDLNTANGRQMFGQQVAGWIEQRRIEKSVEVLETAVTEADKVQVKIKTATATATTFAKGAHVETKALTTSEDAYKSFYEATANFRKLGLKSAKEVLNQKYNRARGIAKNDMFVLMTPEFEALLLGKQGVFASDKGFEAFSNAGVKSILGIPCASTVELPADVNFMVITTGMNGSLGHQLIGDGVQARVIQDPNWAFGQRADMVDNHTKGVVYPFQIFVQKAI